MNFMNTKPLQIKCKRCGVILDQKHQPGPKKRVCNNCKIIIRSEYYRDWYARNGRNRSAGNSIKMMEWMIQNPEKAAAHKAVVRALRAGRLWNPRICSNCGAKTRYLDAHHDDYSKVLEVRWLCSSCHRRHHASCRSKSRGNK